MGAQGVPKRSPGAEPLVRSSGAKPPPPKAHSILRIFCCYTMHNFVRYDTIRYDTRCYFNVRSKANMSQFNLPHGTDN